MAESAVKSTGGRLAEKVVVVTGCGQRVPGRLSSGHATALLFAAEGASIAILNRNKAAAARTQQAILDEGGTAEVYLGDLAVASDCGSMISAVIEKFGRVDVLVNNLGAIPAAPTPLLELDDAELDAQVSVNVKSALYAMKACVPAMPRGSSVVNISSIGTLTPVAMKSYVISKGALETLTRAAAVEFGPLGIRVNCLRPGLLWSGAALEHAPAFGALRSDLESEDDAKEARRHQNLLGLVGTPSDVASAALFFASVDSRFVTGTILDVDGGLRLIRAHVPNPAD